MDTPKNEWIEIAFRFMADYFYYAGVTPFSRECRHEASRIGAITGIKALRAGQFINSFLNGRIGRTFPKDCAAYIAVMWCADHKAQAAKRISPQLEQEIIISSARRLGVDPEEALEFNRFLERLYHRPPP